MFLGEFEHTLDAKSRIVVPASFRERLDAGFVLAPGQDRSIEVFPTDTFEETVARLRQAPTTNAAARSYLRVFLAGAHPESADSQGRITVPQRLREYAGLERDLTITGADRTIQIWDRSAWATYRSDAEAAFSGFDGVLWGEVPQ